MNKQEIDSIIKSADTVIEACFEAARQELRREPTDEEVWVRLRVAIESNPTLLYELDKAIQAGAGPDYEYE